MGTRGIFGFKCGQQYKLKYNHFDSYPDGLGVSVVNFVRRINNVNGWNPLKDKCLELQLIDSRIEPTAKQINKYKRYADMNVSSRSLKDWYTLGRNLQNGNMLTEVYSGYVDEMPDDNNFVTDSLFCEYGYIINLDENTLEFYDGFQKEPQPGNPFGEFPNDSGYYPIKLVGSVPLDDVPHDWERRFYPKCQNDDDCDEGYRCDDGECIEVKL
jgi:hypothetical protein